MSQSAVRISDTERSQQLASGVASIRHLGAPDPLDNGSADVMVTVQAAALRNAAKTGAPFCEEGDSDPRTLSGIATIPGDVHVASQEAALRSAAQNGAPFCQACERPGRRRPASQP